MSVVIKIENLSKKYILQHQQKGNYTSLRDVISERTKKLFRSAERFIEKKSLSLEKKEEFWALDDINLEIHEGDRIGIIGRNGAGKSTLLKILSRITEPTKGRISIKGRISCLLEVGTGFHPELTGRENIYLNGAILGMHRTEIKRKFDQIVDFSGVEKFLDTPVKRYSSGMYVRLAFAVAAHLESEILIVDEVLAVGDMEFQRKCLGKMENIAKEQGRTVLFVSHNMGAINQLCNRAILLTSGHISHKGTPAEIVKYYMESGVNKGGVEKKLFTGPLVSSIDFLEVSVNGTLNGGTLISPSADIKIIVKYHCKESLDYFRAGITIHYESIKLFSIHEYDEPIPIIQGEYTSEFTIPKYFLRPGNYSISIFGHDDGNIRKGKDWIYGVELLSFTVLEEWDLINDSHNEGLVNLFAGKSVST